MPNSAFSSGTMTPRHSVFEAHRGVQQLPGGDPAQGPHPEEPLLLDVGDDQAGGVHVGAQHHLGTAPPLPDDQVPQGIRRHLVGVGPGQGGNDLPHRALVPGGPWAVLRVWINSNSSMLQLPNRYSVSWAA